MSRTRNESTIDWANLLAEHGPALYRTACRLLGRADEAEDCVQDVFVELLSRREAPCVESWAAVLRWLVTRRALDRLRARKALRETHPESLEEALSPGEGVEEQAGAAEMREWLRRAVARLPTKRAEVFALRCFAGMSYEEIAAALGTKRDAVGVILHEARRQLWAMLPPEWVEGRKARCGRACT